MLKKLILALVLALVSTTSIKAQNYNPSLALTFEGPRSIIIGAESVRIIRTVHIGDEAIKIMGPFAKGPDGKKGLAVGKTANLLRIPAHTLVGDRGTIMFTFLTKPLKPENSLRNRSILVLRGEGRERVTFGLTGRTDLLQFTFRQFTDPKTFETPKPIEVDRWYHAACTWDGLTVKFFLDGILQTEIPQPYTPKFPAGVSFFYFGPYVDGYTNPEPWNEDNCLIHEIKVYKHALSPADIQKAAGVKAVDASKQFKTFLAVPQVSTPLVIDGALDDTAWQRASSLITLLDGQQPEESFSYKDNNPKFCHDGKNLYVGFQTIFPATYKIVKGDTRKDKKPCVWGSESFEFWLDIAGELYRFGGNVAGGYCESLNNDVAFNGRWQYKTTNTTRIDNRQVWQGEISIPFETLGVSSPVGSEIKFNFCRIWLGLERIGITSLAEDENYNNQAQFATLKIRGGDTAFQEVAVSNPNFGTLKQKLQVFSGKDANLEYSVKLLSSSGFIPARSLLKKSIDAKAGSIELIESQGDIESTSYDRLLFQVRDTAKSELLMQQVVPFKVVENYFDVIPAFSSAKVYIKPRYMLVKGKAEGNPVHVEVVSPSERILFTTTISSNDEIATPFARDNAAGAYRAVIYSVIDGKKNIFTSNTFNYHGIGPWEETIAEERVLPPFEPMTVKGKRGRFDIGMWGRVYEYKNSLLPTTITALDQPVLTASSLYIDGRQVNNSLQVTKSKPYRVELAGSIKSAKYDLQQDSWIEYDGVLWNSIKLKAKKNLSGIKLKLDIPESMAKFYHTTAAGFGAGGRRTEAIDKDVALSFWPVVWIGGHEQGICWFAESNDTWKTSDTTPIRIVRDGNKTSLEITFADKLDKGAETLIEFGLIATPVKPLPENYPFTMLGDWFQVGINRRPPRSPITAVSIIQNHNAGEGFFDLTFNGATTADHKKKAIEDMERCNRNNVIFAPYQIALYLPEEYQIVKDNIREWQTSPENNVTSQDYGRPYVYYNLCTASQAANYYLYRLKEMLKDVKLQGIYFDFGVAVTCANRYHGCKGGYTILAKREFYKGVAGILADANHGEYTIAVHNSESVQIPTFTFATHFLNGEGLRQFSSSVFHNGKDLLDHYTITDFASEHSSLPWGITSSIYSPTDSLVKQFGGEKEGLNTPQELYKFRMTKAVMAGALIHNTIPSQSRNHYGWFDKVLRFYDDFKVSQAQFMPYWRNGEYVRVVQGKDIYVSFYRHHEKKEILAVISHVSKEHLDQDVAVDFDAGKLGFSKLTCATELLTGPDPEYQSLYDVPDIKSYADYSRWRIPVKLGDFGVEFKGLENNQIKLRLKHHSVAIVKISAE